jgi:hypothetical protein
MITMISSTPSGNILMGFCLGSSEAGYKLNIQPHQNIMFATSVAFPCLPTCFFLEVIKEIHDKNTSLSIYPKKKKQAAETYIFYGRNGSKLQYTIIF